MNTFDSSTNPLLTDIREGTRFLRSVATLVIVVFGFVMYSPSVFAIVHSETPKEKLSAKERYENSFEVKLDALDQALDKLNRTLNNQKQGKHIGSQSWFTHLERIFRRDDVVEARLAVTEAWEAMDDRHEDSIQSKEEIEKRYPHIKDPKVISNLVEKVLENQSKAAEKHAEYQALVTAITEANDIKALKKASYKATKHIASYRAAQPKHIYNSGEMPFGVSAENTDSPSSNAGLLHFKLGLDYDPELDHKNVQPESNDTLPTTDVQINQEIVDLAANLGNDPKRIYNWVYNNIYYIPSYGSIQGSVQTLHNRAGNSFDVSSLLIALLRVSGIPARYVYGVISLSPEQANNWVGGVEDIQSARVIMAQGGIPNSAVSRGGRFEELKIEHVWVESYGNFQPSGEYEWIPLDAAFKQYTFTEGMDLLAQVNFDQAAFQETVENAGIVNEAEGWISNIESGGMQTQLQQLQSDIENLITNLDPNTTLAEVIGGKSIIQRDNDAAPEPLAYETIIRSRSFAALPDRLRHTFRVELEQPSLLGVGLPLLSFEMSLPDLAGKALALSFRPVTPEDEARVEGLFGGATTVEELPTEIPKGYFNVVGEVTVDGEVMASTNPIEFGEQLVTHKGFDDPRFDYRKTTSPITAGDYQAIGIDLQGVPVAQLDRMEMALKSVKQQLDQQNFEGLNSHDVTGGLMHAVMLAYFTLNDVMTRIAAQLNRVVHYRMPSFGTFGTNSHSIGYSGGGWIKLGQLTMDVDWLMANNEGRVNCWQTWKSFNRLTGQLASSYEHIVPEDVLSRVDQPAEFVSTVKALEIANAEGQRIYTIDKNNVSHVLPLIDASSHVKTDIQLAVSSGKTAMVHERPIEYFDYVGSGYILLDPDTGAGAYKISSGSNGAQQGFLLGLAVPLIFLALIMSPTILAIGPLVGVFLGAAIDLIIDRHKFSESLDSLVLECTVLGLVHGFIGAAGILFGGVTAKIYSIMFNAGIAIKTSVLRSECFKDHGL